MEFSLNLHLFPAATIVFFLLREDVVFGFPQVTFLSKRTSSNHFCRAFRRIQVTTAHGYNGGNSNSNSNDDDEPPDVDIKKFQYGKYANQSEDFILSFGFNKGRSSPSQRKAMGRSSSGVATVYLCSSCGSEYVRWLGRCPTCKSWNSLQEYAVPRTSQKGAEQPVFHPNTRPTSWLDGILQSSDDYGDHSTPARITDFNKKNKDGDDKPQSRKMRRRQRIVIPGDNELNTVLGGGIMPGSLVLIGGDPGVGKSTLLLQTAASVAKQARPTPQVGMGLPENFYAHDENSLGPVWYCSGEESPDQVASRAQRLGFGDASELFLVSETNADVLCAKVVQQQQSATTWQPKRKGYDDSDDDAETDVNAPFHPLSLSLLVVDSIQTMVCNAGGASSAGGVTQVRECVALFLRLAKSTGLPILLVGHVTKSGDVAGPRTVEHMVDAVLYLEGSENSALRILRASKNRFGSSQEVGVYEMTAGRLAPVSDPSSLFLSHRISEEDSQGCAIAIALEGIRAMMVEIQALVASNGNNQFSGSGAGKRTVDGIPYSRLMLLLGVLQKRCGIGRLSSGNDIYINVAGRIRLDARNSNGSDNAADLAVAVALVSSHLGIGVRADTAFVGEVGLLGELRPVPSMEKRIQEARRMGFSRVVSAPVMDNKRADATRINQPVRTTNYQGVQWVQCTKLLDAVQAGLVSKMDWPPKQKRSRNNKESSVSVPGALEDLGFEEILDDDYEDDDNYDFQ